MNNKHSTLKIQYVPIKKLKPNEYNPKQMSEKEAKDLEKSIVEFGIVDPLIVNSAKGREGIIIGGHQRYEIYKRLNFTEVPVVWINIPDFKREQELCLRLSKNIGSWNFDLLANFEEETLQDIGFGESELDSVFGLEKDDEYDVEKELEKILAGKERRVKDGDIWQLGSHKLLIGDCTKKENWQKLLGEERFDFGFSDPPYQLDYAKKSWKIKVKTKNGTKLKEKGFRYKGNRLYLGTKALGKVPEYDEWLSLANEFQNPKGANVMVFENWKNTPKLWQAMEKYWKIKNMIIWWLPNRTQGFSRPGFFFQKYDIAPLAGEGIVNEEYEEELDNYLKDKGQKLLDTYEVILYGSQGKSYWDKKKGTKWAKVTDHISWTAETGKSGGQNIIFGTKPIQVLVPYIKILSPRDGIVVDCFGGSGSTLIACSIMKRRCRMMEAESVYGEIILSRWEKLVGKKAVRHGE